ncbi:MAG TPA: hypothetical protein VHX61_17995 [Rhizomicrobium sp.]|jgi:hypothetical protein|nr:hypothetical protein [Rhizomicrobium sp.]
MQHHASGALVIAAGLAAVLAIWLPAAQAAPAAAAQPAWTQFADPNDHAFTMNVPRGWRVQGGLVRRSPVDFSMFLRAISPDGGTLLILGDPGPATFHTPGFDNGWRGTPYRPALEYARDYVQQSLAPLCGGLAWQSGVERPDIANGPLARAVSWARPDAAAVSFTCTHAGKPAQVYLVVATYLLPSMLRTESTVWGVSLLAGCIAPASRIDASKQIIRQMLASARLDPQWAQKQHATISAATGYVNTVDAATQAAFDRSLAHAKAQQQAMAQEYNDFNDVQTQTGTFQSSSGAQVRMDNTQTYHWMNTGGQGAETSTPTPPPGTGWQPVQQVPSH